MKLKLWLTVGYETRGEIIDIEEYWNISDAEWMEMPAGEKEELVNEWASTYLDYGFEELEDK